MHFCFPSCRNNFSFPKKNTGPKARELWPVLYRGNTAFTQQWDGSSPAQAPSQPSIFPVWTLWPHLLIPIQPLWDKETNKLQCLKSMVEFKWPAQGHPRNLWQKVELFSPVGIAPNSEPSFGCLSQQFKVVVWHFKILIFIHSSVCGRT